MSNRRLNPLPLFFKLYTLYQSFLISITSGGMLLWMTHGMKWNPSIRTGDGEKSLESNYHLVYLRDLDMSQEIADSFDQHPDWSHMLVVVGKAHVAGMVKILHEVHGFQNIPLRFNQAKTTSPLVGEGPVRTGQNW